MHISKFLNITSHSDFYQSYIALDLKSLLQYLHGIFDTKPEILKLVIPIILFTLGFGLLSLSGTTLIE